MTMTHALKDLNTYLNLEQVTQFTDAVMLRYGFEKVSEQLGFTAVAHKYVKESTEESVCVLWSRWLDQMSREYVMDRLHSILSAMAEYPEKREVIVDMSK